VALVGTERAAFTGVDETTGGGLATGFVATAGRAAGFLSSSVLSICSGAGFAAVTVEEVTAGGEGVFGDALSPGRGNCSAIL